ncbi:arsenate reductase family protein [Chryseobacterium salipaludis]|uniref:arsenate reductase family protein n=1 Tax=Chryseobacterium TaxID=59732 RepID=UPI001FF6500C|nr:MULTISPECIES: ArsC/Spx/MgsR family protein [Chryseobacterium]MCJ8497025.1 arsenate reductase family protein [Chryseobacterium salipaludis]MCX3296506.1 arsenate reductase family protein [Planobacterium sp. JC490]
MPTVYYLKTCSTCTRIMSRFDLTGWELRELKSQPLSAEELQDLYQHTHSYESLFSKRSAQIKARGLILNDLTDSDFRALLLSHYSFLKRPVFVTENEIFVGNSHHTIERLDQYFYRKDRD